MVAMIGLITMGILIWLLAWAMGSESDSERRKISSALSTAGFTPGNHLPDQRMRRAA